MRKAFPLLSLAAVVLALPMSAAAQVTTPARDTIANLSFDDLMFSNARVELDATQTIGAGSNGTKRVTFDAAPTLESYALASSGAVAVSLNAFTPPASFDLDVSASGAGTWSIAERFSASDDVFGPGPLYRYTGFNDYFVPFANNDLKALELTLFIGGLVDTGGSFGVGMVIPGNWSATGGLGSTTGQHFLANLDDEWVIDTDFVYDAASNVTRFHATNPSYEGLASDHPSPFLDVYLLGAVPEPATWTTMIGGFGAVGFAMRRVRRRTVRVAVA